MAGYVQVTLRDWDVREVGWMDVCVLKMRSIVPGGRPTRTTPTHSIHNPHLMIIATEAAAASMRSYVGVGVDFR